MSEARPPSPWGEYRLEEGSDHRLRIGPLRLGIRLDGGEIWLGRTGGDRTLERDAGGSETQESRSSRPDLEWSRWAVPPGTDSVRLSPTFPDRPLVARPENAFHLVRGAEVRIYVRVPLRIRIELPRSGGIRLLEMPTVTLSDTWFGDVMEGELSYFLPTTARRELKPELFEPHLAVCPLQLSNASDDDLEVEKIALRVAHLSLFSQNGRIWADETAIRYRGMVEGSEIRMSGAPPDEATDADLVTLPRVPAVQGLRARTFARLVGLPGFGTS